MPRWRSAGGSSALLAPRVENLRSALATLIRIGYSVEAGGEPFVDVDDEAILQRVIRNGATLTAVRGSGGQIDLMHSIVGFSYAELTADATVFRAGPKPRPGRFPFAGIRHLVRCSDYRLKFPVT